MNSLRGKIFVVTGSTQGLGRGIAENLAENGAAGILICGRQADKGRAVAETIRSRFPVCSVEFEQADLSIPGDCTRVVTAATDRLGGLDGVVNSAAVSTRGSLEDTTPEVFDSIFGMNVRNPFLVSQAAVRYWLAQDKRGSIVNISSDASYGGAGFICAYSASKAAVNCLTKNIAASYARKGIRCNALCLGQTLTENEDKVQREVHNKPSTWVEEADSNAFLGRILRPNDVGRLCVYLLSSESELVSGSLFDVGVSRPIGPYFVQ